jgi:hypothetical protein
MSRPTLGDLELMQTAYSGFRYPPRAQVIPLLGLGADWGNAVVQSSALTLRQATVSWVAASTADKDAARDLAESLEEIGYTDHNGFEHTVRVIDFSSAHRVGDFWECTATLLETSDPEGPS